MAFFIGHTEIKTNILLFNVSFIEIIVLYLLNNNNQILEHMTTTETRLQAISNKYCNNAKELCSVAKNWDSIIAKLEISQADAKQASQDKKNLEDLKLDFLEKNAKKITRDQIKPVLFYQTAQEMEGKYGWFDSAYKSYKMTEYFSGWEFKTKEAYNEFLQIN